MSEGETVICYKDKTWCSYWTTCIANKDCDRAYTEEVKAEVDKSGLPVCLFFDAPLCYIQLKAKPNK